MAMKLLVLIVGLQLESILNVSNANQKTVAGLTVQRGIAPTVVMTNTQETKARNNKGAKMSESKWREFWIYLRDNAQGYTIQHVVDFNQRGFIPKTVDVHVIEIGALQELKEENERLKNGFLEEHCLVCEKNKSLTEKLRVAVDYLKQINREELNAQRPGGYYSKSATLSYQAIAKLEDGNE